jgi:hypothetical protein
MEVRARGGTTRFGERGGDGERRRREEKARGVFNPASSSLFSLVPLCLPLLSRAAPPPPAAPLFVCVKNCLQCDVTPLLFL